MKIALVSLSPVWENKQQNISLCARYLEKVSCMDVDLVIFPEMTLTGFSMNVEHIAEDLNNSFSISQFKELTSRFKVSILFGAVFKSGSKATNNAVLIDKNSNVSVIYTKIHPFSFANEDKFFEAGTSITKIKLSDAAIGFTICYDLRFPELYSILAKDCDIIVNIANWPSNRIEHWNTLLKARAIENQIFIIGINRTGSDNNGLDYIKSSQIVNANGEILKPLAFDNIDKLIDVYDIDIEWTKSFRNKFLTIKDRKTSLYKMLL